jgi:hypothetical protein
LSTEERTWRDAGFARAGPTWRAGKQGYVLCIGDGGPQQAGTVMLIVTATDTARRVAAIADAGFGQMVLVP